MSWISELQTLLALNDPKTRLLALLVLVFGCVFMLSVAGLRTVMARAEIKRRTSAPVQATSEPRPGRRQETVHASELLARIGKFLAPTDVQSYSEARKEMVKAGYFSPSAVPVYHAGRVICGFGLPLTTLLLLGVFPHELSAPQILMAVTLASAIGFIAPSFFLRNRQKKMQAQYRIGFPDFMDLLVVCVESGLSLQPAIDRISRELVPTSPQLATNLHLLGLELRAGSSLGAALDGLTQRLQLEEAFSLASLLKQSEELGTSLSTALRVYSDEMRNKRLMRAEEKAHALPVKITLPVGFCIFPVILVIVFLPLAIRIKQVLLN